MKNLRETPIFLKMFFSVRKLNICGVQRLYMHFYYSMGIKIIHSNTINNIMFHF